MTVSWSLSVLGHPSRRCGGWFSTRATSCRNGWVCRPKMDCGEHRGLSEVENEMLRCFWCSIPSHLGCHAVKDLLWVLPHIPSHAFSYFSILDLHFLRINCLDKATCPTRLDIRYKDMKGDRVIPQDYIRIDIRCMLGIPHKVVWTLMELIVKKADWPSWPLGIYTYYIYTHILYIYTHFTHIHIER